jgi:hypothetical protein
MPSASNTPAAKFAAAVRKTRTRFSVPLANRAAVRGEVRIMTEKLDSLGSYRDYLVAARAEKARRKGVSLAFEAAVQAQARQALRDTEALGGAALRVAQQMHHSRLWDQVLDKAVAGVKASGPVSAQDLWAHLRGSDASMATLRSHGLTADMESALNEAIGSFEATLSLRSGKPGFDVKVPGQGRSRRIPLGRTPTGSPTSVADLLRLSEFDRVVAAFTEGRTASLDIVASDTEIEYHLADLAALAAVAGHQRVVEHVRKLEDTGLATYSGEDPATAVAVLAVIAAVSYGVGVVLAQECEKSGDDVACFAAGFLLIIAAEGFAALAILAFVSGNPVAGVFASIFAASAVEEWIEISPELTGFTPPATSPA